MALKRKYRNLRFRKKARGKRGTYRRKMNFASRVKRVIMKNIETKYYDDAYENLNLYHNTGYSSLPPVGSDVKAIIFNPWAVIPTGTLRYQRIGDNIMPRGMAIRLWLSNKNDRPNVIYRIIVARLPKTYDGTIVSATNFNPFQIPNSGGLGNRLILPADKDKGVKFLYDRCVSNVKNPTYFGSGPSGKEASKLVRIWIKRKRANKITFDQLKADIVNRPVAIYVIPYDAFGTLTTDAIGSCALWYRMYYKDA